MPVRNRHRVWSSWAAALCGAWFVLAWARGFAEAYLLAAGAAVLGCAVLLRLTRQAALPSGRRWLYAALAVLGVAVVMGAFVERRFERIAYDWHGLATARGAALAAELDRGMADVVERGRRAAVLAADAAVIADAEGQPATGAARAVLFRTLSALRARTRVDAIAVFTETGDLEAWAGDHRGSIPEDIRFGATGTGTHFFERPLYSYLYFSSPIEGTTERAVAAVLVETSLARRSTRDGGEAAGVPETFAAMTPVRASFAAGPARGANVVWSLVEGRDTVVHARFEPATQADLREDVEPWARAAAVLAALAAMVLLSIGWLRRPEARRYGFGSASPLVAWAIALVIAPLGTAFGLERLYSPLLFVLPTPGDLTLGVVLAALLPAGALAATVRPPVLAGRSYAFAVAAGAFAVALGYAGATRLFLDASPPPPLFQGGGAYWVALQFAVVVLLTILTALALPRQLAHPPRRAGLARLKRPGAAPGVAGLVISVLLAVFVAFAFERTHSVAAATGFAVLWAIPFLLIAISGAFTAGRSGRLLRWLTAAWLAVTAVLPQFWIAHLDARLNAASGELESLGAQPPSAVDYALYEFSREAVERELAGEDGLQLLYRTWVASGLAREPHGAYIALWSTTGEPEEELRLGGAEGSVAEKAVLARYVEESLESGTHHVGGQTGVPNIAILMVAPLPSGRAVSVSVPPRRSLERTGALAPFLGAPVDPELRLSLVDKHDGNVPAGTEWTRGTEGWRSDALVRYPEGELHAHIEVDVAPTGMRLARGVLILALDLVLLAALWWFGQAVRGRPAVWRGAVQRLFGSYRARVTVTLFGFFLLPTAVFGWVAYGALAGEVERSAQRIAEHSVRQAADAFPVTTSDLSELADLAGSDVLRYRDGELIEVSSPETLQLGVYGAWMPPDVFMPLAAGESSGAVDVQEVGEQSFLVAYHTVRPTGALAVPTALTAGETAVRQRELEHLILFAALVGAILSLVLSVAVGRALAGPIGTLRAAAAAVGGGQLKVRLPEPPGEFGQLFASFNRMTRRLRRARTQELRTARVLAWGGMARQIAHEIKNPLTPIKLAVQHTQRAYRDGHSDFGRILDDNVGQILTEIDRLAEIARAFSRYGAPGDLSGPLAPVDVGAVVQDALTLYRAGDPNVRYGGEVEARLPAAQARTGELKEVILNLLENARVALEGHGTVLVRAHQSDGRVELEVCDDGPGIPPELLPRIFEPHFSTRTMGAGLGLPIVRRIVESWGGGVTAESEPGGGTTVRVRMLVSANDE